MIVKPSLTLSKLHQLQLFAFNKINSDIFKLHEK